jgi:hypothetical protein
MYLDKHLDNIPDREVDPSWDTDPDRNEYPVPDLGQDEVIVFIIIVEGFCSGERSDGESIHIERVKYFESQIGYVNVCGYVRWRGLGRGIGVDIEWME